MDRHRRASGRRPVLHQEAAGTDQATPFRRETAVTTPDPTGRGTPHDPEHTPSHGGDVWLKFLADNERAIHDSAPREPSARERTIGRPPRPPPAPTGTPHAIRVRTRNRRTAPARPSVTCGSPTAHSRPGENSTGPPGSVTQSGCSRRVRPYVWRSRPGRRCPPRRAHRATTRAAVRPSRSRTHRPPSPRPPRNTPMPGRRRPPPSSETASSFRPPLSVPVRAAAGSRRPSPERTSRPAPSPAGHHSGDMHPSARVRAQHARGDVLDGWHRPAWAV